MHIPTTNGPISAREGDPDTMSTRTASALSTALRSTAIALAWSTRLENNARERINPSQCDESTAVAWEALKPDAMTNVDVHPAIDASFAPPSRISSKNQANPGCLVNWRSAALVLVRTDFAAPGSWRAAASRDETASAATTAENKPPPTTTARQVTNSAANAVAAGIVRPPSPTMIAIPFILRARSSG